jgi:hypothetical protein
MINMNYVQIECKLCGKPGPKNFMFMHGGSDEWFHALCVRKFAKNDFEYFYGENDE